MTKGLTAWQKHGWYRVSDIAHLEAIELHALTLVDRLKAAKRLPKAARDAVAAFEEAVQ